MSQLNKADVCVNHSMAVNVAHWVPDSVAEGFDEPSFETTGTSRTWAKFLEYLESPGRQDEGVESVMLQNITYHACSMSSFVKNGKRVVWYQNPWGYFADMSSDVYNLDVPDMECVETAEQSEIEDVKIDFAPNQTNPMHEAAKIKLLGYRVKNMVWNLQKRGSDGIKKFDAITTEFDHWREHSREGKRPRPVPEMHIMAILQLLKLATNSHHLIVVHPKDSMPHMGPQIYDDIDEETRAVINQAGACIVWSTVYMRRVSRVMGREILLRKNTQHYLDIISETLTKDHLDGEENARLMLAKYIDAHGGQREWKAILSYVYDVIPEKARTAIRTRYGDKSRFHTHWHQKALRELDMVISYITKEHERLYGAVGLGDMELCTTCIAGYVEAINIVASQEAKSRPSYTEETGKIAVYIKKSSLHHLVGTSLFINMVKNMISCKHDPSVMENASRQRVQYQLPPTTRTDKNTATELLAEHRRIYGYGASENFDFIQDTRKRPRGT